MKQRIITSVIAFSLLATAPAWGQTSVIKRQTNTAKRQSKPKFEQQEIELDGLGFWLISPTEASIHTLKDNKPKGHFVIPETISYKGKKYIITEIGYDAFKDCNEMTSISIPNTIKKILSGAFSGCNGLTEIRLPAGIKEFGLDIFSRCKNLKEPVIYGQFFLYLPPTYKENSYTIPEGITTIICGAFSGNTNVTSVTLPKSMTNISDQAFSFCSHLKTINIPNSIKTIGYKAFSGCSGLTSISLPDGITTIETGVFEGCKSLSSITIPTSVKTIKGEAFDGCKGLTSFILPNSVTDISGWSDWATFYGCSGLTNPVYNSTLFAKLPESYKGSYTIPDGIKKICGGAFHGVKELTEVHIPNSVTEIGKYAFSDSGIVSIDIPNSVKKLDFQAFNDCKALTKVTMPASLYKQDLFSKNKSVTLRYPNGTTKTITNSGQ